MALVRLQSRGVEVVLMVVVEGVGRVDGGAVLVEV